MQTTLTRPETLPPKQAPVAGLQEIFSSIQGEGTLVGKRQIFVRFNACHLKCAFCDTPQKPAAEHCQIETTSGTGHSLSLPNPLTVETVRDWILQLAQDKPPHSVSFTGGEPLLYTDFLQVLLPQLPDLTIYLETSGTQPEKLATILDWVDIVAMDIKLPSATKEPFFLAEHQAFYQLSQVKDCFVKLVFCDETPVEEVLLTREIVTDPKTPVILQPMTDWRTGENLVSAETIFKLYDALAPFYPELRVIPQTHKMLALL